VAKVRQPTLPPDEITKAAVGDDPAAAYLVSFPGVVALDVAIARGLIDRLARGQAVELPPVLAGLLQASGVLASQGTSLTPEFSEVWQAQAVDLAARTGFLRSAAADIARHGEALFFDTPAFMQNSATFDIFDYEAALHRGPTALATTARWVAYVSALTRAEGAAVLAHLPLPDQGLVLELGGNSGAFARMVLAAYPGLSQTILDLPGVCRLGAEDPENAALGARLRFVPGDMRRDDWRLVAGQPPDVVLFKSVLHDWPDAEVEALLSRAAAAVAEKGRILIAERSAYARGVATPASFADCGNLVFSGFYRDPELYAASLRRHLPQARITIDRFALDMGWAVTVANLT
jgi:hypothetical protein